MFSFIRNKIALYKTAYILPAFFVLRNPLTKKILAGVGRREGISKLYFMKKIPKGCTLWSRGTTESDIFYWKPDKWFKIWFYIISRVNFKQSKQFKRGEALITYKNLIDSTKATHSQVDHCLRWLRKATMIATRKTTRGMFIKVLNYKDYQDLRNYKSDTKSDTKSDSSGELPANCERIGGDTIVEECYKNEKEKEEVSFLKKIIKYGKDQNIKSIEKRVESIFSKYKFKVIKKAWRKLELSPDPNFPLLYTLLEEVKNK